MFYEKPFGNLDENEIEQEMKKILEFDKIQFNNILEEIRLIFDNRYQISLYIGVW